MYVCFLELLNDVLVEVKNAGDFKLRVEKLQSAFSLLVIKVENTLKTKNIDLHKVKMYIDQKLHTIDTVPAEYRQKLHVIQDFDSLFDDFLLKYHFISYLNYVLLKEISKLSEDEIITNKFEKYEELYVKLISEATFKDTISTFCQNPNLKPSAPIGLPIIIFRLEDHWQEKTLSNFADESDLPYFESFLLSELREKCIIITYAVFPSVLPDVVEYLKSSTVQQKFQGMGVSVELPEDLGINKEFKTYNCIMYILIM